MDKIKLVSKMVGENSDIKLEDIPVSETVNLEELKEGDDDPLQVIVYIGKEDYQEEFEFSDEAMKSMVEQINKDTVNGYLGHRKPENLSSEYPDIVTYWIGAKYSKEEEKVYVRGYIAPSITPEIKKLKYDIRNRRTVNVSIFGKIVGEERVSQIPLAKEIHLLSIDWTPLNHQGMDTGLVLTRMRNEKEGEKVMKIKKEELKKMIDSFEEEEIELERVNQKLNTKAEEPANQLLAKLRDLLGVEEEAGKDRVFEEVNEVLSLASRMREVEAEKKLNEKKEKVEKMIAEKAENEELKRLTLKMVSFDVEKESFEEIEAKVNSFVSDEEINEILTAKMIEKPVKKQKKTEKEYKYLKPKE